MVMSQMSVERVRWEGWAVFVSLKDSDGVGDADGNDEGVDAIGGELSVSIGVDILSKVLKGGRGENGALLAFDRSEAGGSLPGLVQVCWVGSELIAGRADD